jgi:hypothetical protein
MADDTDGSRALRGTGINCIGTAVVRCQRSVRNFLGRSATMPPAAVPILLVLLATAAIKSAPNFLLQHTGYFRTIARLSIFNIALMTAAVVTGLLLHADVVGFLALYAGTFVVVAALYVTLAVRGPLRDTAKT